MWHTRTYFHSLINVCDRFLERTKLSRSGARPGRELFITRLGLGAHGGANGLVPLLPASLCEPDKAIRIALGERHAEKCAMRKTLSGGFWTVSTSHPVFMGGKWSMMGIVRHSQCSATMPVVTAMPSSANPLAFTLRR